MERARIIFVFLEQSECVWAVKIFKLNETSVVKTLIHGNEFVVVFAGDSLISQTNVVEIFQEDFIVRANVQGNWQTLSWVHTDQSGV